MKAKTVRDSTVDVGAKALVNTLNDPLEWAESEAFNKTLAKTLSEAKADTLFDIISDVEPKLLVDTSAKTIIQAKAQKVGNTLCNTLVVYFTFTLKYGPFRFLLVNCSLMSLRKSFKQYCELFLNASKRMKNDIITISLWRIRKSKHWSRRRVTRLHKNRLRNLPKH